MITTVVDTGGGEPGTCQFSRGYCPEIPVQNEEFKPAGNAPFWNIDVVSPVTPAEEPEPTPEDCPVVRASKYDWLMLPPAEFEPTSPPEVESNVSVPPVA